MAHKNRQVTLNKTKKIRKVANILALGARRVPRVCEQIDTAHKVGSFEQ